MLRLFRKSLKTGIITTDYPKTRIAPAQSFQGLPEWQEQGCVQCGRFVDVCPTKAIK